VSTGSSGGAAFLAGERPRPEWLRRNPRAWLAATATVCFGGFMGQLDASVVALTYHDIGHSFGVGLDRVQWISLSYLIALAALLVPLGRLSDRLGRKRVYLWGFALFTLASIGCALAPNLLALVLLRAAQGTGAAMLQANSIALVSTAAPAGRLRTALGIQAAAQAVGLAVGPTVGGIVVQAIGWRWVFGLNVPVGVVAMIAGRYLLPRTRISGTAPGRRGLADVLRRPAVPRNLVGALLAYLTLFGPIVLLPALLLTGGRTPLAAGLIVATLPAGFALGAVAADRVLPVRWPTVRRERTGIAICIAALAGLFAAQATVAVDVPLLALLGAGLGVFIPANNAAIMTAVPSRAAALAGGLVNTARALGTAAGTAIVAVTLTAGNGRLATAALLAGAAALAISTRRTRRTG
jgi:MFS family permease